MIDKKEIEAYRSIKAPEGLKEKILNRPKPKDTRSLNAARICYAVAAVFALIITLYVFYPTSKVLLNYSGETVNNSNIPILEANLNSSARGIALLSLEEGETAIPLEIETDSKTEIKVSDGYITQDGKNKGQSAVFTKDTAFYWTVTLNKESCTLTVISKGAESSYRIFQNSQTGEWSLKKVNN